MEHHHKIKPSALTGFVHFPAASDQADLESKLKLIEADGLRSKHTRMLLASHFSSVMLLRM